MGSALLFDTCATSSLRAEEEQRKPRLLSGSAGSATSRYLCCSADTRRPRVGYDLLSDLAYLFYTLRINLPFPSLHSSPALTRFQPLPPSFSDISLFSLPLSYHCIPSSSSSSLHPCVNLPSLPTLNLPPPLPPSSTDMSLFLSVPPL